MEKVKHSDWVLTDDATLQCRQTVSEAERIYRLVQIDDYRLIGQPCRISQAIIRMDDYSEEEIQEYLQFFGYLDMEGFKKMYDGEIAWEIIAEMIFETDAMETETPERYTTWEAAVRAVESITGLALDEYLEKRAG